MIYDFDFVGEWYAFVHGAITPELTMADYPGFVFKSCHSQRIKRHKYKYNHYSNVKDHFNGNDKEKYRAKQTAEQLRVLLMPMRRNIFRRRDTARPHGQFSPKKE